MTEPLRAAVVGAGPAGLTALVALHRAGLEVVCLEKGDRPGGRWAYGAPLSGAYRSLHLNTSRARTELAEFPMPSAWPDFPSHERIGEYFDRYVDAMGVRDLIRFGAGVERAERGAEGGWTVHAEDGFSAECDVLVVASGHNWEPRLPEPPYPGTFDGREVHAHDYREPDELAGRRVLVVGMGNSAMDIAVESSTVAERTLLSTRRGTRVVPKYVFGKPADQVTSPTMARLPWQLRQPLTHLLLRAAVGKPQTYGLPPASSGFLRDHPTISDAVLSRLTHGEIEVKPGVKELDGDGVMFSDGTREVVDTIVWCTGYRVTVPYVDEALLGAPPDELPLFKRMFHPDIDDLFFIGLVQTTGSAIPVVERQSELLADHLTGRYALPPLEKRRADAARRRDAAAKRYGERKRPHLRVEFDGFMRELEVELRRGRRRAGGGVQPPVDRRDPVPA